MPIEEFEGGGSRTTSWDAEQKRMASIIIREGQKMGVGRRGIIVALATAMQESSLRNLNHGDRDSQGLFQQRPSMGWGTVQQVTDPVYATRKFYTELQKVKGWQKMPVTVAAQSVQRSGFPDAYAKWVHDAQYLFKQSKGKITPIDSQDRAVRDPLTEMAPKRHGLGPNSPIMEGYGAPNPLGAAGLTQSQQESMGIKYEAPDIGTSDDDDDRGEVTVKEVDTSIAPGGGPGAPGMGASAGPVTGMQMFQRPEDYVNAVQQRGGKVRYGQKGVNATRQGIVDLAQQYVGTPYVWGGTDLESGVDCSGFIQSVYKQMGVDIPRVSYQQATAGKRVNIGKLSPGDIVAWDNSSRNNGADHVAIYLGNGRIIEAPRPGIGVRIRKLGQNEGAWGVQMNL